MKTIHSVLLFFVVAAQSWAQLSSVGAELWSKYNVPTPSQAEIFEQFHSNQFIPVNKPLERPAGESISVARLRHRPPGKAVEMFGRGIKAASKGEWLQSQQEFQRAVGLDPEFSEAFGNLGVTDVALGLFDSAARNLRRAIELDPATGVHHLNYACALTKLNRDKEAELEAQTAVALDPGNSAAHYLLGFLLGQRPETRGKAVDQLTEAARQLPEAHYILAQIYRVQGDEFAAKQEMQTFERLMPGEVPATDTLHVKFR